MALKVRLKDTKRRKMSRQASQKPGREVSAEAFEHLKSSPKKAMAHAETRIATMSATNIRVASIKTEKPLTAELVFI